MILLEHSEEDVSIIKEITVKKLKTKDLTFARRTRLCSTVQMTTQGDFLLKMQDCCEGEEHVQSRYDHLGSGHVSKGSGDAAEILC